MMCGRRERMEIILHGGKPWGFSIKGGSESNKPLVISKLEYGGKAESSGLCVGDVIFSVNHVPLSGVRSEAIKLVKSSGKNLMMEIERGVLPAAKRDQHYNARSKQTHDNNYEHYRYGPGQDSKQPSFPNHDPPSSNPEYGSNLYYPDGTGDYPPHDPHILKNEPNYDMYAEECDEFQPSEHLKLEENAIPTKSLKRSGASDVLSSSPSSVSTFSPPPEGAVFSKHGSEPKLFDRDRGLQRSPYFVSNESVDRYSAMSGSQGNVRMRRPGRARDKIAERPSSWHASKHPEIDRSSSSPTSNLYEDRNMRSPGSSGCQSPQQITHSGFYYPSNQPQIKRKLKGWSESGDLKSTLKKDINGSKDSLISSSSRHSYKSGRLSVSSSRSSGNMSSSRGSLDNLDSYHRPDSHESIPEVVRGISGHSRKNSNPSQPQLGNVDSKKNMFEKFSLQEQSIVSSSSNHDSALKPWSKYHTTHDVAAKSSNLPWKKQYHEMGRPLPSSSSREELRTQDNSRRSSLSPSGVSEKKSYSHANRDQYEKTYNNENIPNVPLLKTQGYRDTNVNNNASVHRQSIEGYEPAESKPIKTPILLARDSAGSPKIHDYVQFSPPHPPVRDSSSQKGVMHFQQLQNVRNRGESEQYKQLLEPKTVVSPSSDRAPIFANDPTEQTAVVYPVPPVTPSIASPVTEDQKAVDNASRSARMFGVMAYGGDRKNVVAKTITISSPNRTPVSSPVLSRAKPENKASNPKTGPSPRYEHLKDAYTFTEAQMENKLGHQPGTDYASRAKNKQSIIKPKEMDSPNEPQYLATNFTRFDQNKDRASGRYGEVWKTPQIHRRSRSSDANSIIRDSSTNAHNNKTNHDSSALSVFKPKETSPKVQSEPVETSSDEKTVTQATNKLTGPKMHKPQSSFDAKSRQTIYHSSGAHEDDITRQLEASLPMKPATTEPETTAFTGSSIVQALRNSRRNSAGLVKSPSDISTNSDNIRRKKSTTHSLSPSIQEVNQDEDDEAFVSQNYDDYTNNIKGMSKKVLRVTSFTRRDLELSPSSCPFDQRRQMFEYSRLPVTREEGEPRKKPIQYMHGRSRSQGNELEEGSILITSSSSRESVLSSGKSDDENLVVPSRKPRPKSAGNQRNRAQVNSKVHEPKLHQNLLSSNPRNAGYMQMKAGSLPRNMYVSLDAERHRSPHSNSLSSASHHTLSPNFTSPEHRRVEVEVRPGNSPDTQPKTTAIVPRQAQPNPQSRNHVRNAIFEFVQKKTGNTKLLKTSRVKSSSNFYPQQPMTESKFKEEEMVEEEKENSNQSRNVPVRAKSTSSLLEDSEVSLKVSSQKLSSGDGAAKPPDFSDHRSSSLENLTADSISTPSEDSYSKPSDWKNHANSRVETVPHRIRTRSSSDSNKRTSNIQPSSPPHKTTTEPIAVEPGVQPPPRTKRQRYSQSSASSATTISTLSSFSSSSSTSLQASSHKNLHQIPPLEEQDASDDTSAISANDDAIASRKSSIKSPSSSNQDKPPATSPSGAPPSSGVTTPPPPSGKHRNFNSGTYKIVKGMRKIDPSIKIPVVYPEDDEFSHIQEGNDSWGHPNEDHPAPQVPQRRKTNERTSVDSVTSSHESENSPHKKSSAETSPSPSKTQKSRRSKSVALGLDMLPPPPPPPPASTDELKCEEMRRQLREMGKFPTNDMDLPPPPTPPALPPKPQSSPDDDNGPSTPNVVDTYREQTYILGTDSSSESNSTSKRNSTDALDFELPAPPPPLDLGLPALPPLLLEPSEPSPEPASSIPYENIKLKSREEDKKTHDNYVNVCVDVLPPTAKDETHKEEQDNSIITAKLNEELTPSNLTKAIIKNDKALAQVLCLTNKKTLDYMHGILPSSRDIVEAGIRYRKSKPANSHGKEEDSSKDATDATKQSGSDPTSNASTLPASETYYQTSASKAKIMNLVQEKVEGGEIDDSEDIESIEEINSKKVELISSITNKMSELQSVKDLIKIEMKENEELGKEVNALAKSVCTAREHEKFNTFVEEVDKIINLLLSLSGRLARVENALASLSPDAKPEERNSLLEKKEKLTLQHEEAKMLKDNVDKRQKTVSEILASYLNTEQFADYEHYIKMKTALIMEQRELDDKMKLGAEQMQCLRDSLSEDWLEKLEKMLATEAENKEHERPEA